MTVELAFPDANPTREKVIANLRELIARYQDIAEGPRPGLAAYATKRIPELEAALARHEANR